MRIFFIGSFLLVLLSACVKEEIINDPRYQQFVGEWQTADGAYTLEFSEDGVITTEEKNERGQKFRVTHIYESKMDQNVDGEFYKTFGFKRQKRNPKENFILKGISIYRHVETGQVGIIARKVVISETGNTYNDHEFFSPIYNQ